MRRILKLENNGAFRIAPSLKILSKNNYSSPQNTTISNCEPYFYILRIIMPSRILSNHRSILFNYLLLPLQQIHFWHSSNDPTAEIPLALPFSSKKKEKPLDPSYISLPPPWTLISNLKQFPISSWNRSENQSTASSKWKKGEGGEKLLPTIPNPLKPSSDLLDLLARPPSTSTGSVGIGPWTQTFAIHCKESVVKIQRWTRKRKGAAGNESRHAQARSRGKVGKLVVGQQQVAQSRHNNNNDDDDFFSF